MELNTCMRTVIAPISRDRETIGQHRSGVGDLRENDDDGFIVGQFSSRLSKRRRVAEILFRELPGCLAADINIYTDNGGSVTCFVIFLIRDESRSFGSWEIVEGTNEEFCTSKYRVSGQLQSCHSVWNMGEISNQSKKI